MVGVEKSDSLNTDLKTLRCSYPKNVIFSYININSIRNKLDNLQSIINNTVDVLAIAETKIDDSFPSSQFNLKGYKKPYRLDINSKSGGLLIYVNNDITSRKPKHLTTALDIQAIPVELNLKKQKWLIISIYRPPKQCLSYFLEEISNLLDMSIKTYENIVLMGDFNAEPSNIKLKYFHVGKLVGPSKVVDPQPYNRFLDELVYNLNPVNLSRDMRSNATLVELFQAIDKDLMRYRGAYDDHDDDDDNKNGNDSHNFNWPDLPNFSPSRLQEQMEDEQVDVALDGLPDVPEQAPPLTRNEVLRNKLLDENIEDNQGLGRYF